MAVGGCFDCPVVLPAMVLAAGLGTRLRPLTDLVAKPLVPVGDRPAIAHVLDRLRAGGAARLVVNAHHHAAQVRAFASSQPDLAVSEERELLGTAGGVAQAAPLLGEGDVLLWNADILADVDVGALMAAHASAATLVVQRLPAGQGTVGLDPAGRIVRLRAERFAQEATGGQFLGVYVLGASLRARLPPRGGMIEDVLLPALARGDTLRAFAFEGAWRDVGTVASYLDANADWLTRLGQESWIGPGARIGEGVVLDRAVVGPGASVAGRGPVTRSVVWPGAHATAPLDRQVVTA
jgi:mannose-1-phosphate guanylyltransferase